MINLRLNIKDILNIFEWYGVADGERGMDTEETNSLMLLYQQLPEEDRQIVFKEYRDFIQDALKN